MSPTHAETKKIIDDRGLVRSAGPPEIPPPAYFLQERKTGVGENTERAQTILRFH